MDSYIKNSHKIMNKKAKTHIGQISRGYPVSLQLLGFYSFQRDNDDVITVDDINDACRYIVVNVKKNEFDNKHESIGYGLAEKILKKAVIEWKGEISQKNFEVLFQEFPKEEVIKAIKKLIDTEILYKVVKGEYLIRDYLFHTYLKKYYRNE
jgi:hypothetical protein